LRKLKLSTSPLCEPCERRGQLVPANTVDHIIAIANGGDPYPSLDGLMSMCTACHNAKTRNVEQLGASGRKARHQGL
jgi:5-methylcytosine-specific restriction endonuclease McrA